MGTGTTIQSIVPIKGLISNVVQISAGYFFTLAVLGKIDSIWFDFYFFTLFLGNGTACGWGNNGNGQLGINSTGQSSYPTLVSGLSNVAAVNAGGYHSLGLLCTFFHFFYEINNLNVG